MNKIETMHEVLKDKTMVFRGSKSEIQKEFGIYKARNRRVAKVLHQGWEPFNINSLIYRGLLEPMPLKFFWKVTLSLVLLLMGLGGLSIWLYTVSSESLANTALGFGTSSVVVFGAVAMAIALFALFPCGYVRREDTVARVGGSICIYRSFMPSPLWQKYKRAKRLFDCVYVCSNDKSLYEWRQISLPDTDPFLVGRIGNDFFLGGQWDLAKEIELVLKAKIHA